MIIKPLQQRNKKIRDIPYTIIGNKSVNNIGRRGCALLACANAYRHLTGENIEIQELVKLSIDNDCLTESGDTKWKFMHVFSEKYGLSLEMNHCITDAIAAVDDGAACIVSAHGNNKKLFTNDGHWMTIVGADANNFIIHDSCFSWIKYLRPNAMLAMIKSKLSINPKNLQIKAGADLIASETKPHFPEYDNYKNYMAAEFGCAILRKLK
ncbi:MAG: C39 family peptidase [Rickettsiales bacterium]|jgi:hypothetical protein|nr:C39 family peptidase [Rickettsiales bacterium]